MEYTLGILAHDGMTSVVCVSPRIPGTNMVWATFGEITANGFSPCYASNMVPADSVKVLVS